MLFALKPAEATFALFLDQKAKTTTLKLLTAADFFGFELRRRVFFFSKTSSDLFKSVKLLKSS